MKRIVLLQLILLRVLGGDYSAADNVSSAANVVRLTPEFINQLAEEMRTNHPALLAADFRTNAAAAGVSGVRTWDDVVLRAGGMAAEQMMRAEDGDILYGAEQKLPLWGKPALARRLARAELDVESANARYQFQFLKSALAKFLFRAALAEKVVMIGEQDHGWLQTIEAALQARYQAGQATQVELLQAQNERARRATQLQSERNGLAHDHVSLNRLLNRPQLSSWPSLDLPGIAGTVSFNERLVGYATKFEPRLRMMREQIKQAQAMVDSTRRSRLPDVSVGAESRNYSGNGEWRQAEFMLSFNLPLFNAKKYRADIVRDEAKLKAAELDAADYELSLREEVHGLTVRIDAARREALLYRDEIIPRSELALESARAGWETGRNTFRDVLDARRMLLDGKLMHARAVAEQYEMLSDLVLCCGLGDLEALQMLGAHPETETQKP
jgi:outer membrane protein TolC